MVRYLLALVSYGKESVGVCLFSQLVQVSAFANQLTDDVQVVTGDTFSYRPLFNE